MQANLPPRTSGPCICNERPWGSADLPAWPTRVLVRIAAQKVARLDDLIEDALQRQRIPDKRPSATATPTKQSAFGGALCS